MQLRILQPGALLAEADVDAVTLPGAAGELTPMQGHDLLITPLCKGVIRFRPIVKGEAKDVQQYQVGGGIVEVLKDAVTVFTTKAEEMKKQG